MKKRSRAEYEPIKFRLQQRVRTVTLTGVILNIYEAGVMPKARAMIDVDGKTGHARYQIIDLDKLEEIT